MTTYDTEVWPYVPARDIGPKRTGTVRLGVIHVAEASEKISGAEDLARYFLKPDYTSSCHISVDNDTIVQSVKDSYVAYAAPGANHDGIQIEIIGYASQTKAQWLDKFSIGAVALAADAMAQYCLKYSLPAVHLSNQELLDGKKGIVGHYQVSQVYKKSDHMDPGPNFPWARFIMLTQLFVTERK